MNYAKDTQVTVRLMEFERVADVAMDVAAIAHRLVYQFDPAERMRIERMRRTARQLHAALERDGSPHAWLAKRLLNDSAAQDGHDDGENSTHDQVLELTRQLAAKFDRWADKKTAAVECKSTAA